MCKRSYLYAANVKQQGKISTRTTPKIRPGKYVLHTSCTLGKMFQNASSLKPLGQLKPNCP